MPVPGMILHLADTDIERFRLLIGRLGVHAVGTLALDKETLVDESANPTGEQTMMRWCGEG